jgi:hypothetical protein
MMSLLELRVARWPERQRGDTSMATSDNHAEKNAARRRQTKTGESYSTALRQVRARHAGWSSPRRATTNKEQFLADQSNVEIGRFRNEYGEEFVIFQVGRRDPQGNYFVTGDEFDWEMGYEYLAGFRHFVQIFLTNPTELEAAKRIIEAQLPPLRPLWTPSAAPG